MITFQENPQNIEDVRYNAAVLFIKENRDSIEYYLKERYSYDTDIEDLVQIILEEISDFEDIDFIYSLEIDHIVKDLMIINYSKTYEEMKKEHENHYKTFQPS